jgi:hypothetical protein
MTPYIRQPTDAKLINETQWGTTPPKMWLCFEPAIRSEGFALL